MKHSYLSVCIFFLVVYCTTESLAQKFLAIDRYSTKRKRLQVGDPLRFRQVGNPAIYNDYIALLKDTTLILSSNGFEFPLRDFETIYFQRLAPTFLQYSGGFIAAGFLFAAAVHPLVSNAQYDRRESLVIGASFLTISQGVRFFKWNKYHTTRRARVRIIDTTFKATSK